MEVQFGSTNLNLIISISIDIENKYETKTFDHIWVVNRGLYLLLLTMNMHVDDTGVSQLRKLTFTLIQSLTLLTWRSAPLSPASLSV